MMELKTFAFLLMALYEISTEKMKSGKQTYSTELCPKMLV